MSEIALSEHYADVETSSEGYARRFSGPTGTWLLERQAFLIEYYLRTLSVSSALDVGGGHAQLIEPLTRHGIKPTILGSSLACKTRVQPYIDQGQCSFEIGSPFKLPYADKSFDLVTCIRLLSHCERQWPELIKELCRVARTAVIIDYPPRFSINLLSTALFSVKKRVEGNTRPFSIFSHTEVRNEFEKNSFLLKGKQGQFILPMVFHRALKQPKLSEFFERILGGPSFMNQFSSPVIAAFTSAESSTRHNEVSK